MAGRRRHGDRRPGDGHDRALLAAQEAAPAPRQRRGPAAPRAPRVPDTTSGFRAYNREAALQLQVVSKFTYTLESLIQAGKMLVAVDHVPVRTNEQTRPSRLFPSMWAYVRRNGISIFRIYALYEPLRLFLAAAALVALVGAVIWVRFAWFFVSGRGRRPRPVADPRVHAVRRRGPARRARGGRGHPRRQPRAPAADPRARPARGAPAGRGALALRAGRRRGRARGHDRRPGGPATGKPGTPIPTPAMPRARRSSCERRRAAPSADVPTGNTFDKYGSTNPVVKRLMAGFHARLDELWAAAAPESVLDVGCGEGVLTAEWAERLGDGPRRGHRPRRPEAAPRSGSGDGGRTWSSAPRRPPRS